MKSRRLGDNVNGWLTEPPPPEVCDRLQFMSRLDDVAGMAVMPDVHLSKEFCIGTVLATRSRIYPGAIGQDIGCGMTAIGLDCHADSITEKTSEVILKMMKRFVPIHRHPTSRDAGACLQDLDGMELSHHRLRKTSRREGRIQLGTLGRGNHFLELQADGQNRIWAMVHSGSRGMGHAITNHHLPLAETTRRCPYFHADSKNGRNYLNDAEWAIAYARQSRLRMIWTVCELIELVTGGKPISNSLIDSNHNHVRREVYNGIELWVHRKGAQSASLNELGIIPGSMGTSTYHVVGRGCSDSYFSCSHGAGRRLSRTEARKRISARQVRQELHGVYCETTQLQAIREESPSAYKDIRKVMRAQRELVGIHRQLRPLLNYKGV